MMVLCSGIDRADSLGQFLLSALMHHSRPILVTGEESFDFFRFFALGRFYGLSRDSMGDLLVANSVNMYHLRDIIRNMEPAIREGAFPIFLNFSRRYLDENVPFRVSQELFRRDLEALANYYPNPVFFWETGGTPSRKREELQAELYQNSTVVLDGSQGRLRLVKNILTEKERGMLYGSSSSGILHFSGRFIQGLEAVSQFSAEGRSGVF